MTSRRLAPFIALAIGLGAVAGCSVPARGPAVPPSDTVRALPLGIPNARFFADGDPAPMIAEAALAIEREQAVLRARGEPTTPMPPASFLAISGGADNGAFGAGFIDGWTATGTRPQFRDGDRSQHRRLIAPFVFLGPGHDWRCAMSTRRWPGPGVRGDADRGAVRRSHGRYRSARRNHRRLRRPEDARCHRGRVPERPPAADRHHGSRRPAAGDLERRRHRRQRHPKSLDLFRKILLASASIPGAFRPMLLDVEIDGENYQEMHVDGGAIAQLFLYPGSIDAGILPPPGAARQPLCHSQRAARSGARRD